MTQPKYPTKAELLANEFSSLSDEAACQALREYSVTTYKTLNSNEASQIFGLLGFEDALTNASAETRAEVVTLVPGFPTTIGQIISITQRTLAGGKFATDPNTDDGDLNRRAGALLAQAGVLTDEFLAVFFGAGEGEEFPYANTTVDEVRAYRYPSDWQLCDHGDQDFVVSVSAKDFFRFQLDLTSDAKNIAVRLSWRESGDRPWRRESSFVFNLSGGESGQLVSQVVRRMSGLSAARHFCFEYKPVHAGQVASVAVSVGQ